MRKPRYFVFSVVAGIIAGVSIGKLTKRMQYLARETGEHIPFGPYEALLKRPLDILLAGSALILLSPVMGITALLIKIKLGSPVLFTQQRPGLNEKIFKIYKYRTMTDEKDINGKLLPDNMRLTKFGQSLRSTSLDELPELVNILKGDMSIVGPRPLLVEYLERYNKEQKHRHDVKPGLTGYAQIRGRNNLSWDEKFRDDLQYMKKITFCGDLKIIMQTIRIVLNKSGINSETSVTMDIFLGDK